MDRLLLLDLYLRRILDEVVQKDKHLSVEEQENYLTIFKYAEEELQNLMSRDEVDEAMMDEGDLVQSQLALLKKLVQEAKEIEFRDTIDSEEEEEDETLRMIIKLKERKKSEPKVEEQVTVSSRRRVVLSPSPTEQKKDKQANVDKDQVIDDIAETMVGHAEQLKLQSKQFQKLLTKDEKALFDADQNMNDASGRFQRESGNLRGVTKRSWRDSWRALGYFCLTILVFFFMYIFIRLT